MVKHNVEEGKLVNIYELELFFADEFQNTDTDMVKNCMLSMKKRYHLSLIDSTGEWIKY